MTYMLFSPKETPTANNISALPVLLGAALENFPVRKGKKSVGSTYARKIEAKKTS
jgi:hypothetical protein